VVSRFPSWTTHGCWSLATATWPAPSCRRVPSHACGTGFLPLLQRRPRSGLPTPAESTSPHRAHGEPSSRKSSPSRADEQDESTSGGHPYCHRVWVPPSATTSPHRYSEDPAGPPLSPNHRHDRPDTTFTHTNVSFATGHHLQLLPTPWFVSTMTALPVDEREASSSLAVSASTASRPATPSATAAGQHAYHGTISIPCRRRPAKPHSTSCHPRCRGRICSNSSFTPRPSRGRRPLHESPTRRPTRRPLWWSCAWA
jgi:hypothetical protein